MERPRSAVSVSTDFLIATILAFILLFYWPAPLRYQFTLHDQGMLRIDRITGDVAVLENGQYKTSVRSITREGKLNTFGQ